MPKAMKMYARHGLHLGVLAAGSMQARKQQVDEMVMTAKKPFLMWNNSLQEKQ